VHVHASVEDQAEMLRFADSSVSEPYGFLNDVCVALSLLFGNLIEFGLSGQSMCSGFVASAETRMGVLSVLR
jgi:hypothetical protein